MGILCLPLQTPETRYWVERAICLFWYSGPCNQVDILTLFREYLLILYNKVICNYKINTHTNIFSHKGI